MLAFTSSSFLPSLNIYVFEYKVAYYTQYMYATKEAKLNSNLPG